MEDRTISQPELVGRREELDTLRKTLADAFEGHGSTVLVSGEAGIGKTRLVSEMLLHAEKCGARVLRGWCLPDCMEPLMPIKEALRGADMLGLMQERPPPKILSAYVMNDAGMLYAKSERTKTDMDGDIFTAMLRAVSSFVSDSLRMMGKSSSASGLSTIGHSGYKILVQTKDRMSLAVVIEGDEDEFLIESIGRELANISPRLNPEIYDSDQCRWLEEGVSKFVNSARFDGAFIQDDPKLRLENLFDSVLLGLQRASLDAPVVFFIDDVQWADPTTLSLFHYLSRNTRSKRVLMVATYRPEDVVKQAGCEPHHLETVMQNMSRESLYREVRLSRLGESDTDIFVAKALGSETLGIARRIHRESEGNPFFTLEVLRLMEGEGIIARAGGTWALNAPLEDLPIPSKVYDVIRRRLNRLKREESDMLECASVVGEKFGSDVLGLSLGMNRLAALKMLNDIEKEHRLIRSMGTVYCFDHSKIREVMYTGIGTELRAEYHRTVAHSYAQLFSGREQDIAEELAHHFTQADDPNAAKYLTMAGDRAMKRYANDEAISFYSQALDRTGEGKLQILQNLGDLYTIVGQCDRAVQRYSEALELTAAPLEKAEIYRKMAMTRERQSEYALGIKTVEAGLALLGPEPLPLRSGLLAALTWNLIKTGNYEGAMEKMKASLDNATVLNDRPGISAAHHLLGIISWFRGSYDEALDHYHKALTLQRETGDERAKVNTLNNIGVILMETGRLDAALEHFNEGLAYEEKVGDKDGMAGTLDNLGNLYHTRGELDRALGYHLRGLEFYRMAGDKNGIAWSLSSLGYTYPDLGDVRKGIECHLESVELCREIGDQHILVYNYYGLAESYSRIGEFTEALRFVDLALSNSREIGARREEGASVYVLGTIQCRMGKLEESRKSFAEAKEILSGVGETSMLTMVDYDYGLLLEKEGKKDEAVSALREALESFKRMEMGLWQRKTEAALARLGAFNCAAGSEAGSKE
ncbi:MAG: tetratricopeptide repeat protein [Thermoplasmata archaeon]|nr:tetratricopeptide repeat protein [Thermoplasmata archaeon]